MSYFSLYMVFIPHMVHKDGNEIMYTNVSQSRVVPSEEKCITLKGFLAICNHSIVNKYIKNLLTLY